MIIGVPKEIKREEYRVALTPDGAAELVADGCSVMVEARAGEGSGFSDSEFLRSGARVVPREELFQAADLIVKVKEPLPEEFSLFRENQMLFTYLHLAPNRPLIAFLLERRVTALAYETLEVNGTLPLLAPMSEVAGRMAPLVASYLLQRCQGGRGVFPPGVPGVRPATAVILGAGTVGLNAARVADGIGMDTVVLNRSPGRLQKIDDQFHGRVRTVVLQRENLLRELRCADIVIGALLVPGGRTPVLITRDMLSELKKGAVLVDVSVDQGGAFETSRPTTHENPSYEIDGIIHYCVANMPGAYPRTSTCALTGRTLPYIRLLAVKGLEGAQAAAPEIRTAINICSGSLVHPSLQQG